MQMLPISANMISWGTYNEDLTSLDDSSTFTTFGLLEQINVTRDASDYLWYITRYGHYYFDINLLQILNSASSLLSSLHNLKLSLQATALVLFN